MTKARDVVSFAAKQAGILGVGQTLLAEDINDCYTLLVNMIAAWQKNRWLVPALIDISKAGNSTKSNTIGTGGYWNVPRPNDIKGGYIIQLNTGTTPVSLPLIKIFSYEDYIKIAVKDLNTLPTYFFYDGSWPLGNVFIWPIPSSLYECHLLVEQQLNFPITATDPPSAGTGLDTDFVLPPEYLEAINYNLSIRISDMYQLAVSPETLKRAKSSLNVIKVANTQVPTLTMPKALRKGRAFNIFNPDGL